MLTLVIWHLFWRLVPRWKPFWHQATFTDPKIFWAGPDFMSKTKNWFSYYCATPKDDFHLVYSVFVPVLCASHIVICQIVANISMMSQFHECFDLIFGGNLVFGPSVRTAPQRGTLFETCRTNATCFVARADDLFADFCCLVFGVRWCSSSLTLVWEFSETIFGFNLLEKGKKLHQNSLYS